MRFITTQTAHVACPRCLELAKDAVAFAQVRGSVGGTHSSEYRDKDNGLIVQHSATVVRDDQVTINQERS
jgi:hypothetical protein